MGNTPSSETPRRVPHKLLKPRPASLAFDLAEDPSPSSDDLSSPASTRYCHSYLAGSHRTMSYQHLPSPTRDGQSLYRQPSVASLSPSAPCSPWRQPEPFDATAWSQLHEPHAPTAAASPEAAGSRMKRRLSRAKSVIYPSGCATQSLTRAYSFHSNAYTPYHPSMQLDLPLAGRRRFSTMESARSPDGCDGPLDMDFSLPHMDDALGLFAQASDPNGHSSAHERANSTSYVPMRRRSIIQTPGVATRAAKDHPPMPTKPVIQISHLAPTAGPDRGSPICSDDLSSPKSSRGPCLEERSVTPCDANYRQLGGIKFGTLRITNGSPSLSPAAHSSDWIAQLASPPVASTQASLVIEEPAWPLGVMAVTNPDQGVEAVEEPKFHTSQASPSDTSPTFPNQKTPRKGHCALILENCQNQVADSTPCPPPSGGIGTPDRRPSPPSNDETALSQSPGDVEYISPEVLNAGARPATNSQLNHKGSPQSSSKSQNSSVGSESGFVSSATSSRKSSQRTLHKADSGYGSNFSLRSIRSNSFKLRRDTNKVKRASEAVTPKSQQRQQSLPEDHGGPDHLTNHPSTPLPRNSSAIVSREKIRRRLSTQTSEAPASSPSAPEDQLAGQSASETVMRRATMTNLGNAKSRSSPGNQETPAKQGKLHRLLGSAKRQSRVPAFVSPHDVPEPVPAIPSNLEEKLHGRDGQPPSKPSSQASPTELRQQPRKTVWTEEVVDFAKGKQHMQVNSVSREPRNGHAVVPGQKPRQPSQAATPVPPYSPPSYTEKPSTDRVPPVPTRRRPLSGSIKPGGDGRREAGSEKAASEARGQGKDGSDARGLGRASTHEAAVSSPMRTRQMLARSNLKTPARLTPPNALKSRASAPNLASPHPPLPAVPSVASSNAAPPMSFRTRSMKTARDLLPSQAFSSKKSEAAPSRKSSRESFHWRPPSANSSDSAPSGAQPQTRHSYSVYGRHPPVVYRQPRQRQARNGESQSFRILHSYNSPAYKNAPIWG